MEAYQIFDYVHNYLSVDVRIPPLVIAVKAWAKSHDINSAFQGSLSSYLLVTMIIYFLQTGLSPPILPPLRQYVDSLQSVNVNTQLQQFVPKTFIRFDVRNREELGEIFVKFFQFWVRKFRQNKVFSVYTAQEAIRTYNTPFLDTNAYVLVLEGMSSSCGNEVYMLAFQFAEVANVSFPFIRIISIYKDLHYSIFNLINVGFFFLYPVFFSAIAGY
jgi:hypothetical protein